MPLSPRTLRPSSAFSPKSIPGLALWLDGSDANSLYTTDAGPVTAVSSPLDIAGCALWLDASDTSTITQSGGLVSQWNDKSGNGRHATASTTARPTSGTRTVNGLNALDFDGTANVVQLTGTAIPTAATHSVFFVYRLDSASQSRFSTLLASNPAGDQEIRVEGFGSTAVHFYYNGNAGRYAFSTYLGLGPVVYSAREATGSIRSAGASVFSSGSGVATAWVTPSMTIGGRPSANFMDGLLCEVIIFSTTLSDADTSRVEAYLAAKWGISGVHAPATAASDPVGAWLDKSGNARHLVQSTATKRPLVGSQNSRKSLTFDGSDDNVSMTPASAIGSSGYTAIAAIKHNLTSQPLYLAPPLSLTAGNQGRPLERWQGGSSQSIVTIGAVTSNVGGSYRSFSDRFVYGLDALKDGISSGTHQVREYINGAINFDTSNNGSWTTSSQRVNVGSRDENGTQYKGDICELCVYDRRLSASERQRLERYLAAKWGITLAPQVSNADAQDWVNRVYANGGTVSASAASAVNTFCDGCLADDIWAKMNTIGLLCGASTLSGAITPLKGGTFTNNNFISGDYNAATGLKGGTSAQNKAIVTSLLASSLSNTSHHLFVAGSGFETTAGNFNAGGVFVSAASSLMDLLLGNTRRCRSGTFDGAGNAANAPNSSSTDGSVALVRTSSTDLRYYSDGVSGTAATNSNTPSLPNVAISVFARNDNGTRSEHTAARLAFFSIGSGLTATETLALHNRVATLRNAIAGSI